MLPATASTANLPVPADAPPAAMPQAELRPGLVCAQRYELRRELSPAVWLAVDLVQRREVRLVVVSIDRLPQLRKSALGDLTGIRAIRDIQLTPAISFYTTDFIPADSLREQLQKFAQSEQRMSVDAVRRLGSQLLDTVTRLPAEIALTLAPEHILITPLGNALLSEETLRADGVWDHRDIQRQVAAVLYESLTGFPAGQQSTPADQVRGQVPPALAATLQRAAGKSRRQFRSLAAFARAWNRSPSVKTSRESALAIVAVLTVVSLLALGWWLARPVPPKFTKADYSQKLGSVLDLQKRCESLDSQLQNDADAARDELDKWQREINSARESDKPVQREYAEQRLAECRSQAELRVQLGQLWLQHSQRATWRSTAAGEFSAAQSHAAEGEYDQALERLQNAETLYGQLLGWKPGASRSLALAERLQAEIKQQQQADSAIAFAYDWPTAEIARLTRTLADDDGQATLRELQALETVLPQLESLLMVRGQAEQHVNATVELVEIRESREQRETAVARFQQADDELRRGELAASRTGYETVVQELEGLPLETLRRLVTSAQAGQGDGDVSLTCLNKALSLDVTTAEGLELKSQAYLLRAQLFAGRHDSSAALRDCEQALQLQPQLVAGRLLRGSLLQDRGELPEALREYNQALAVDPTLASARTSRAALYVTQGDYAKALADCDHVLQSAPDTLPVLRTRAVANFKLGNFDRTVADCTSVLQQESNAAEVYAYRAAAFLEQRDFDHSIQDCDAALQRDPQMISAYQTRAKAWFGQGDAARARTDYEMALRIEQGTR